MSDWSDKPDHLTDKISSDFQTDGFFARQDEALKLVGNRRSKGALVDLVTYLLKGDRHE